MLLISGIWDYSKLNLPVWGCQIYRLSLGNMVDSEEKAAENGFSLGSDQNWVGQEERCRWMLCWHQNREQLPNAVSTKRDRRLCCAFGFNKKLQTFRWISLLIEASCPELSVSTSTEQTLFSGLRMVHYKKP